MEEYSAPGFMPGCYIQATNGIRVGRNVYIAPGVRIISGNHDMYDFARHLPEEPVVIGDNCWLGTNATILPGVQLGDHVIVGAGSVVTKSFGSDCVVAGVPASLIKQIGPYTGTR